MADESQENNTSSLEQINKNPLEKSHNILKKHYAHASKIDLFVTKELLKNKTEKIEELIKDGTIEINQESTNLNLILQSYKTEKYEENTRADKLKDAENLQKDLQKKITSLDLDISIMKSKNKNYYNNKNKDVSYISFNYEEKQKETENFVKKLEKERLEIEKKRLKEFDEFEQKLKKIEEEEKVLREEKFIKEKELRQQKANENIENINKLKEARENEIKESNKKINELQKKQKLFQRNEEKEREEKLNALEKRKQKLQEIRDIHKPINLKEIKQHENNYLEKKRQNELRIKKEKLNKEGNFSYEIPYESKFYKDSANEFENKTKTDKKILIEQKLDKIKEFDEKRKQKYYPKIDENKRDEIEQMKNEELQKLKMKRRKKKKKNEGNDDEYAVPGEVEENQTRKLGHQYFQEMKNNLKKKENVSVDNLNLNTPFKNSKLENDTIKTSPSHPTLKINYLQESKKVLAYKEIQEGWKFVIKADKIPKERKKELLKEQAEKMEKMAKMQEEVEKNKKKKSEYKGIGKYNPKFKKNDENYEYVDSLLLSSIKAKIAAISDNN